ADQAPFDQGITLLSIATREYIDGLDEPSLGFQSVRRPERLGLLQAGAHAPRASRPVYVTSRRLPTGPVTGNRRKLRPPGSSTRIIVDVGHAQRRRCRVQHVS